ncbi:hypothetical protein Q0Z83_046860 [Actinoplanes sichuanensis]|uniref:protein phosphatase 2C domain-containing protein n=1 Tax=Actinoplanes sichuanensis TaxID=512349 RepID=UPI00366C421B|nr:hypothetical protein Q0Z83_046860 [Actinoplanes sichuanensis]
MGILFGGFLELQLFANQFLITLAGTVAILAGGVALQIELIGPWVAGRRTVAPLSAGRPRPRHVMPPPPRRPGPPPAPIGAAVAVAPVAPVVTLLREAAYPTPPLFGRRPSRAHALPWLLPKPVAQSGVAADEARLGDLTVRAASLLGPGHRCEEPAVARQDAYSLGRDTSGRYLIAAVADGLSSSPRSDLGAAVAAETTVDLIGRALARKADPAVLDSERILHGVAARMTEEATRRGLTAHDMCAVLIAGVFDTHSGADGRDCWFMWIGDVSGWQLQGQRWEAFAGDVKSDDGDISSNAVNACLPLHPGRAEHRRHRFPVGAVISLVSDGIGDAWTMMSEANAYFGRQWAEPPALGAYLNDVGYDARGFQDDRTAVTVWAGR